MTRTPRTQRGGTILPLVGVCLISIFAFTALAVDLGLLAVSRTQCQNAADVAALVGTRTLNNKNPNDPSYDSNRPAAIAAAKAVMIGSGSVTGNYNMNATLTTAQIASITAGQYNYDPVSQTFTVSYPSSIPSGQSWTAMEVVLSVSQPTNFMKVLGVSTMPSGARAVAVHRPRDVAFVLDMTGSMGYASTFNTGGSVSPNYQSNNPDTMAPVFGHYVDYQSRIIQSSNHANSNGEAIPRNNFTIATPGGPAIVRDFQTDPANLTTPSSSAYPVTSNASSLKNAFHWNPPESGGDSANYIGPTYDFSSYNAFDTTRTNGPTPAPDWFGTMTDSGTVTYIGDRYRRADGSINKTDTTWNSGASTTKAAGTAVELLGYNLSSGNVRNGTSGGSTITSQDQFRDPVWEVYGYDLDIVRYRAWKTSSNSGKPPTATAYLAAQGGSESNILVASADRYKGYSMGPGYWGKTPFIWPPDPRYDTNADETSPDPTNPAFDTSGRAMCDWRRRFFLQSDGSEFTVGSTSAGTGLDQTVLKNTSGSHVLNNGGFDVNYPAVLKWIKSGPQTLPPNLRAGRVLFYSSIPDDVDTSTGSAQQQLDKVFWKNYIDYVLAQGYTSQSYLFGDGDSWSKAPKYVYTSGNLNTWAGSDGTWTGSSTASGKITPYMAYSDSPNRPRLHFWFGPMSMLDFVAGITGNWNSGTIHEAHCWQLKAGMNSVLDDLRNNHPNDWVGMTMFAYSGGTSSYRDIRVAMGQNYTGLKNALFYPKSLLTAINGGDTTTEIRAYTSSFTQAIDYDDIPNANGSTDPNTGLMGAFNLLSPSSKLGTSYGTQRGRRGASKLVIFETDGVPNSYTNYSFKKYGYDSYYSNWTDGGTPGNGQEPSMSRARSVVQQMAKTMSSSNTSGVDSGLSLPNAPTKVYPIAFGDLFDTTLAPSATFRPTALQFLANIAADGGTGTVGATTLPSYQIITGTYTNRIATLKDCMQRIFQSGVSVTLIE